LNVDNSEKADNLSGQLAVISRRCLLLIEMNAGGATSGVLPFVRKKSAGIALRFFACLVILFVSVISIAPSESFAAPASSPSCATGVGVGGPGSATLATTRGGNGCVVIKYSVNGSTLFETFNYTGADQTWTVPTGVTNATLYLLGAAAGCNHNWNRERIRY
jgi:hypothetical protein